MQSFKTAHKQRMLAACKGLLALGSCWFFSPVQLRKFNKQISNGWKCRLGNTSRGKTTELPAGKTSHHSIPRHQSLLEEKQRKSEHIGKVKYPFSTLKILGWDFSVQICMIWHGILQKNRVKRSRMGLTLPKSCLGTMGRMAFACVAEIHDDSFFVFICWESKPRFSVPILNILSKLPMCTNSTCFEQTIISNIRYWG